MKRVIAIDEETYDKALHPKDYDMSVGEMYDVLEDVLNAVFNGTPLNDVLDNISDEINDAYENLDGYDPDSLGTLISKVDEIIDKYKESEGK